MSTSEPGDHDGSDRIGPSAHADAKANMREYAHPYSTALLCRSFHFSCSAGEAGGSDENGFGFTI